MCLTRLISLALVALLMACAPAAETVSFKRPDTPSGRICTNQCNAAQDYCHQSCSIDQRQCLTEVQGKALADYDKYTREQFARHEPIELRPSDFERPAVCDATHKSCVDDCDKIYAACFTDCGGKVDKTTSCQFLCF